LINQFYFVIVSSFTGKISPSLVPTFWCGLLQLLFYTNVSPFCFHFQF